MKEVIIIGGGASGIMAGIFAAREGANVTILEHKDRIGKKILATGNGKCNLSNLSFSSGDYYSDDISFVKPVFQAFSVEDTVSFFEELGMLIKNKNGYLYPATEQATTVLDFLRMELRNQKVRVETEVVIDSVDKKDTKFVVKTSAGLFQADSLIIACGSMASPQTGSDGSGYLLCEKFGHRIVEPVPALVQLRCKETYFKSIAGVRTEANLTLMANQKIVTTEYGELQLTDYGISGIPVFQFSRVAAKLLLEKKKIQVVIDFIPFLKQEEIIIKIEKIRKRMKQEKMNCNVEELFQGFVNKKILLMLLKQKQWNPSQDGLKLEQSQINDMVHSMKNWTVTVTGTNSYQQAQVCAGGVDVREIGTSMNSKLVDNLFFAGEIVDVDGKCGGYNLQWAWSSGQVAGKAAAK